MFPDSFNRIQERLAANANDFDGIIVDILQERDWIVSELVRIAAESPSNNMDVYPTAVEELLMKIVGSAEARKRIGVYLNRR